MHVHLCLRAWTDGCLHVDEGIKGWETRVPNPFLRARPCEGCHHFARRQVWRTMGPFLSNVPFCSTQNAAHSFSMNTDHGEREAGAD